MAAYREVFVLQTWIAPRTIQQLKRLEQGDCEGFWLWDLNDLFATLCAAQQISDLTASSVRGNDSRVGIETLTRTMRISPHAAAVDQISS